MYPVTSFANSLLLASGGTEDNSINSASPLNILAVEVTMSFILLKICSPNSFSKVLIVPSITTSFGIMFGASPPANLPIVITAGLVAGISLLVISCIAKNMWAAMFIGSTPVSGRAPWHPVPFTTILNLLHPPILVPNPHTTKFDGVPELTCIAIAASTLGFWSTPASIIFLAPVNPSSSGWNTNLTVPSISSWFCLSNFAAPKSIAVCISWPHECIAPLVALKSQSVASAIGRASISALNKNVFPGFEPSIVATIPLSQISSGSYPNSLNLSIT